MNKKSQHKELVFIILIVIVLIALLFFIRNLFPVLDNVVSDEVCRMSAVGNVKTKILGQEIMQLNCPRKIIYFEKEGYKFYYASNEIKDLEKIDYYKRFDSKIEDEKLKEEFYKLVADEMANCWYKLGEGDLNFFKGLVKGRVTEKAGCIFCSEIININNVDFNKDEFIYFLKNNKYTKYGINSTYYDYLHIDYGSIEKGYVDLIITPLIVTSDTRPNNFLISYNIISNFANEAYFVTLTNNNYHNYFCDVLVN
jgi:hypothetical protein